MASGAAGNCNAEELAAKAREGSVIFLVKVKEGLENSERLSMNLEES